MVAPREIPTVQELIRRLIPHGGGRIKRLILYGSRALGAATPQSDIDLLVVEAEPVSKREEMQRLRRAVGDWPVPVDVRVMGHTEFEETKEVIGGLAYAAHKHGVTLYESA